MTGFACILCRDEFEYGCVIMRHRDGYAHLACMIKERFAASAQVKLHIGCGECVNCEQGHPERCRRDGC